MLTQYSKVKIVYQETVNQLIQKQPVNNQNLITLNRIAIFSFTKNRILLLFQFLCQYSVAQWYCQDSIQLIFKQKLLQYCQLNIEFQRLENMSKQSIQKKKEQKLQKRNQQLRRQEQYLTEYKEKIHLYHQESQIITRASVTQLVEKLNDQKVTSQKIVVAYARKAIKSHEQFNLITQDNFQWALQVARQCDRVRRQTKKKNWTVEQQFDMDKYLPPLFGIPISVKDSIDMQGFASTLGLVKRLQDVKQEDGLIIKCLKNGGMIPFVKSNVPQLLACFDCGNNLWGISLNPYSKERTPGGSSGGQAGLICSGGSPIGIGSDSGGSLRIPAEFCGLCTLIPGSRRLSSKGHTQISLASQSSQIVPMRLGPLTRSTNDIALWMKTVTYEPFYQGQHYAFTKLRLFDDRKYIDTFRSNKLKIGYIKSLSLIEPTMAGSRALQQTINALQQMGHEMVPLKLDRQEELVAAFFKTMGGQADTIQILLDGQQPIKEIKMQLQFGKLWNCVKKVATHITSWFQPRVAFFMKQGFHQTVHQYHQNSGLVKDIKQEWTQMLKQRQIDAVICPAFGSYAVLHGQSQETGVAALYPVIWNILDLPVGSVPVTTVRVHQQLYESKQNDMISQAIRRSARGSVGLPVGIQVVGLPFEQEKVLGLMRIIQYTAQFSDQKKPQCF